MRYLGLLVVLICASLFPVLWFQADWPFWEKLATHLLLCIVLSVASATLLSS
jgi:hypothetical protein